MRTDMRLIAEIDTEIARRQQELDAFCRVRDLLMSGQNGNGNGNGHATTTVIKSAPGAPLSIADAVESILREVPKAHASQLAEQLETIHHIRVSRKNLINTLNRWVGRRKRFVRPEPNTFALDLGKSA